MSLVVTAALSVSEQIKDIGAYAGVASIVGLAVLSLLYFGQARELKSLREWAGRAPERTAELQEQAAAAAAAPPRRGVAQPGAIRAAAAPVTAAGAPAAPVVPAPATAAAAAATRPGAPGALEIAKPAAAPAVGVVAAAAAPVPSATPAATPAAAPAAAAGQETQAMDAVEAPAAPTPGAVPPAPTVDDPTTGSQEFPVPLVKASAGAPGGVVPPRPRTPATTVPASVRARGAEPWPPPLEEEVETGRRGILAYAAGGVAVLLVLVVLATQLFGGSDDPAPTNDASIPVPAQTEPEPNAIEDPSTTSTTPAEAPALVRSDFSVFVLNGTATNGLGASVNSKLEKLGYRPAGSPQTAADQTEAVTRVSYAEGKKRAANDVAKQLGVAQANVVPVDAGTNAQGAGADIIVTIGADKAAQ